MTASKAQLRAWAKSRRLEIEDRSEEVVGHLTRGLRELGARKVLAYRSLPGEPDVSALAGDFELFTTRTIWRPERRLTVHPWSAATELDRFGILQPPPGAPEIPLSSIHAVLVPGLAFDLRGGRLGTGGGFYDRLLADFAGPIVGVTWSALIVSELPTEPHDVPVKCLATERTFGTVVLL